MSREYKNRVTLPSPPMESNTSNEPVGKGETATSDSRLIIAVTSYRWGKHDPDGVSCKAVLDGLIQCGILRDDSTDEIQKICLRSKKAKKKAMERTTIEIYHDGENLNAWC